MQLSGRPGLEYSDAGLREVEGIIKKESRVRREVNISQCKRARQCVRKYKRIEKKDTSTKSSRPISGSLCFVWKLTASTHRLSNPEIEAIRDT